MEQLELIKRVRTTQNIVFWVLMWVALYYSLSSKKRSEFTVLVLVFLFALSYFMMSFYFIKLSGYVGNDVASNLFSLYQQYQITIKKFAKIIGLILLVLLILLLLVYLPNNNVGNRMSEIIVAIFGSAIGGLIVFYLNKKQNKE